MCSETTVRRNILRRSPQLPKAVIVIEITIRLGYDFITRQYGEKEPFGSIYRVREEFDTPYACGVNHKWQLVEISLTSLLSTAPVVQSRDKLTRWGASERKCCGNTYQSACTTHDYKFRVDLLIKYISVFHAAACDHCSNPCDGPGHKYNH